MKPSLNYSSGETPCSDYSGGTHSAAGKTNLPELNPDQK